MSGESGRALPVGHGSVHGRKRSDPLRDGAFKVVVFPSTQAWTVGDDQGPPFFIPDDLDDTDLDTAEMAVKTVSSSGKPTVQIRNITQSVDMLTTKITCDVSEKTSFTASVPSVIDTNNSTVAKGDEIAIDIDGAGTGTQGLVVMLGFS